MFDWLKHLGLGGGGAQAERERLERLLAALGKVSRSMEADYQSLRETVLAEVVELTDSRYGFYGDLSQDGTSMAIQAWSSRDAGEFPFGDGLVTTEDQGWGLWADAVSSQRTLIVNDYQPPPADKQSLSPARIPLRRVLVVPIVSGGRVAAVAVCANKEEPYGDHDASQVMAFFRNVQAVMERQRVSEALRRSQAELQRQISFTQASLEALTHPFYVVDIDTHEVLMANRAAIGDARQAGGPCYSLVHDRDQPCQGPDHACPLEAIRQGAESATVTHRHLAHGSERLLELHAYPMYDAEGKPDKVILYSLDVTDRHRAQEELRRSRQGYKDLYRKTLHREEMYQSLLNATPDAVAIYDLNGQCQYVNPAFTRTFGYTMEELRGRRVPFVPEDEAQVTSETIRQVLAGESVQGFDTKRRAKDGRVLDIVLSSSCYYDHDGNPNGIVVVLHDVTTRRHMEGKLRQAQKMEAVGTLASGIAHDFNNIMQIIYGYVDRCASQPDQDEQTRLTLEEIKKATERAGELVQRLLTFSRQLPSELKPANLNHLVFQAVKILERTIPKMITIEPRLAPDLGMINADETQMQQVLMNLGGNARDAMEGGGRLVIETENLELDQAAAARLGQDLAPGPHVRLRVSDDGVGMAPETVAHVFEPFFTTKPLGEGTGMGLATVYGVVRNHGGAITCESAPGRGTSFTMFFPRLEDMTAPAKTEPQAQPRVTGGSESILVVDDERQILELAASALSSMGYSVRTALSGEEALESLQETEETTDLVLLDLNMPGMGGLACLVQLKHNHPGIKVLVSTGYAGDAMEERAASHGADGFLVKPYQLKDLLVKVREVLDGPRAGQGSGGTEG